MSTRAYRGKRGTRWQVVLELGTDPVTGKRRQETIRRDPATGQPIPTQKRAKQIEREELVKRHRPGYVEPEATTVTDYLQRWLTETRDQRAAGSHGHVAGIVRVRLAPQIGDHMLADLSPLHIQAMYRAIAPRYTRQTLVETHAVLRAALAAAVRWRLRDDNPAEAVTLPQSSKPARERRAWTRDEARSLLSATDDGDWGPLWRFLYDAGCRIGEALALRWADVDLDSGRVRIVRTLARDEGHRWVIAERTKTASSRRALALAPKTVAALRRHGARQKARRLEHGQHWIDLGLVFDRGDGAMLDPVVARRHLRADCKAAGVPYITPHGVRRTAITLAVGEGQALHAVSRRAGHRSVRVTDSLYALPDAEADRRVSEALDRLLDKA